MAYSPGAKVILGGQTIIDLTQDTVEAGKMLSGITAHGKSGALVTGNIPSKAAATINTSSSDQTIAAGQYLSGAQTIRKVTTQNIEAANIKKGVVVKVGDAGSAGRIKDVTGTYDPVAALFPVGKLWATEDSTEDPATVLGFGTWARVSTEPTWDDLDQSWEALDGIIVTGVYVWKRTA